MTHPVDCFHHVKMKRFALSAIAWLLTACAVPAGPPYLPLIGPAPLRLQPIVSHSATASWKQVPGPSMTSATNTAALAETAVTTVAGTNAASPSMISLAGNSPHPGDAQVLGDSFAASVFSLPAPDLLGISPEMLATYFHPVQLGTNAVGVLGPFHVSFTPPVAPDNSSHASYIVK